MCLALVYLSVSCEDSGKKPMSQAFISSSIYLFVRLIVIVLLLMALASDMRWSATRSPEHAW